MMHLLEELREFEARLQARYQECDIHGHLLPYSGYCEYCFRHLDYSKFDGKSDFEKAVDHFDGLRNLSLLSRKYHGEED